MVDFVSTMYYIMFDESTICDILIKKILSFSNKVYPSNSAKVQF